MAKKPDPYKDLSENYDLAMGPRDEMSFVQKLVKKEHPKAKTLLEIGCGTGTLLKPFATHYSVVGLDVSEPMLKLARERIPRGRFHLQDMTTFDIGERFDVVLCLFNSLNHLGSFSEWQKTFRQCRKHLSEGGVLIFDINTPASLKGYYQEPPRIEEHDSRIVTTQFSKLKGETLEMLVRVFSPAGNNLYGMSEARILEKAYPTQQVRTELKRHFDQIKAIDPYRKKADRYSEVLYFVCRG